MQNNTTSRSFSGSTFDVIVCGSGASGSVVARRLSDDPDVNVLLIEAGGLDYPPTVSDAGRWPENLGSAHDWAFPSEPQPELNGRSLSFSMGKIVGGSTSINAMIWARGHQQDWDHYAEEAGDPAWNHQSILSIYREIEDYHGNCDLPRGKGGLVRVDQPASPHPVAVGMVDAARSLGIATFANPNGLMMEGKGGCAISDIRATDGRRHTIFDSYVRPVLDRPNLTLLTDAEVARVVVEKGRAVGVEVFFQCQLCRFTASHQVVLSTGAINTPRILMQSGIGEEDELRRLGIPVVQHLPGVGENLQDHLCFSSVFEYRDALPPQGNGSEATLYATIEAGSQSPDVVMCQAEFPFGSPEIASKGLPEHGWAMATGLARPKSRGRVRLRSASRTDRILIQANALTHPADMKVAKAAVELTRELGEAGPLRALTARQSYPGTAYAGDLEGFIRDSAAPFWHQTCTAKMGRDAMSVVDGNLKVYGIEGLTIADGSVFPSIPTGNTMAPCVVVGERASQILRKQILSESTEVKQEIAMQATDA